MISCELKIMEEKRKSMPGQHFENFALWFSWMNCSGFQDPEAGVRSAKLFQVEANHAKQEGTSLLSLSLSLSFTLQVRSVSWTHPSCGSHNTKGSAVVARIDDASGHQWPEGTGMFYCREFEKSTGHLVVSGTKVQPLKSIFLRPAVAGS